MIQYDCPHCGHRLAIPEEFAGKKGKCNKCSKEITVPRTLADIPTFESAQPKQGIPKPLLYGGAVVAGLAILLVIFFGGLSFLMNDVSNEMAEIVSEVGDEFEEQPHVNLRTEIEELSLEGDRTAMDLRLRELEDALTASKDAEFKTAAQIAVDSLNEQLAELNLENERELLEAKIRAQEIQNIHYLQDGLATKMGHADASNQIDETGEHAQRIHAALNKTRRYFVAGSEDWEIEEAVKIVKRLECCYPDVNYESSITALNQGIKALLAEIELDEEGNPSKTFTIKEIANEVFAYYEYEYYLPQMEARMRQQANQQALAAQIAANNERYKSMGAAINAQKDAALRSHYAAPPGMMEDYLESMARGEANRQADRQR